MNLITERTQRLVLAELTRKEALKDVSFFRQRVEVEPTSANRQSLADAEAMVAFCEGEISIWS